MWGNSNNTNRFGNGNDVNATTNLRTSNSDTSSMTIALWNSYVSLNIRPVAGVDGNGTIMYDKQRSFKTALSAEACEALLSEFRKNLLPIYEDCIATGKPSPGGQVLVETGAADKKRLIGLEMGTDSTDGVPDMYFVIYAIDGNGCGIENLSFKHKFPKKEVRIGYNPATGLSEKTVYANADFNLFLNMLGDTDLALPYSEHVSKYAAERKRVFGSNRSNNGAGAFGTAASNTTGGSSSFGNSAFQNVGFGGFGGEELPFN